MPRRRFPLRALTSLSLLTALIASSSRDARAGFPPPAGATPDQLKDPANWPNDPDYGPQTAGKPDPNGTGGTWQYWSWIPQHDATHPVRPQETATGMSIDVAWTFTIGDPRVKLAEIDTGILWNRGGLIHQFALNLKELQNAKPLDAAGAACGGSGDLAGFDCNGDGVFNMYDYEVSKKIAGGKDVHDANANGAIDPGDLIVLFSDGVDDDHNGYTDDICGWDFFKDDNDAYDDTSPQSENHGSGEMDWSVEEGNDGQGGIGVCPKCEIIPLRVGDSFVSEVQDNAQAIVYATDVGAKVIQQANGTVNQSNFMRAAFDYAYTKGTVVVSTAADENSRHHNMPGTANHTIVVHAINKDADEARSAHTYLNYNPCSDYGGQVPLSVSGSACASEATGRSAGIAGLMYSLAMQKGIDLTPEEVKQLMIESADLIDVPESYDPNNPDYQPDKYYPSHPYFSQRFGYGRQDAGKIMAAIDQGKIPPEVDIESPQWFEVLYPAQLTSDVPIKGHILAKRASTYDGVIEWAPGIEPSNDQWKQIGTIAPQPGTTSLGSDGTPLGYLKMSEIGKIDNPPEDPKLKDAGVGDPNEYAITVRVKVTAHYGDKDVPGEMRKVFYVHDDPDLVAGFPKYLGASGEGSARLYDLDGDGKRDILYPTADGALLAMHGDGTPLPGFPFKTRRVDGLQTDKEGSTFVAHYLAADAKNAYTTGGIDPDLARESILSGPAIGDLDGDGKPEIVFGTYAGTIYAIHSDATVVSGWPIRLPDVPSCPRGEQPKLPDGTACMDPNHLIARGAFAGVSLADMDKDGKLDVIVPAFDSNVWVFDGQGQKKPNFPVAAHYKGPLDLNDRYARILTTAAVGDVTGDGIPEIGVGNDQQLGKSGQLGAFFLIDGQGMAAPGGSPFVDGWPQVVTSLDVLPLVGQGLVSAGMMADIDGDGTSEIIFHGTAATPVVYPVHPHQPSITGGAPDNAVITLDPFFGTLYESPHQLEGNNMVPIFSQPSIGDLDQDGKPDVVAVGASFFIALALQSKDRQDYEQQLAFWSTAPQLCKDPTTGETIPGSKCGPMFPGSPTIIEDYTFFHNSTIADLTGDDYPEMIVGTGGYYLRAVNACGNEAAGFPKFTGQWIIPSPAVGDIDGDKKLEVVTGTRDGWIYAWHTNGREDGVVEWPTYHHDERNTGNVATPTGFPGKKAGKPMDLSACVKATPGGPTGSPSVEGGSKCGCELPGSPVGDARFALAVGALVAGLAARRRRAR